jgi:Ca2+-binding RTX toxin-like protein
MSLIYERRGGDIRANARTAGHQDAAEAAVLADGRIVLVWRDQVADGSGTGIRGRIFAADGVTAGDEFAVNAASAGDQIEPGVIALTGGGFLAFWTETNVANGDGSGRSIKAQIYNAAGAQVGTEFVANAGTAGNQSNPAGAALPGGGFVLAWTDVTNSGDVAAQRFDAAGTRIGEQILVNTTLANAQYRPAVAALADGRFVVAWTDMDIRAQLFAADGSKLGAELLVSQVNQSEQSNPTIAALAGGGFVIAWEDNSSSGATGGPEVKARLFDRDGAASGGEVQVNVETDGSQYGAFVAALAGGGFAVSWTDTSRLGGDASGNSVKLRLFDAAANALGGEQLVTAVTTGNQFATSLVNAGDDLIIAWADLSGVGGDASGSAIKYSRLVRRPGTEGADVLAGTEGGDTIDGLAGDDRIDGGGGDDILRGGDGDDLLSGGEGHDQLDLAGAGDDQALGGAGNDGFYFGSELGSLDSADGGPGDDQLALQGHYAGFGLSPVRLAGVETIALLSGADTRFGDLAGARYQYALSTQTGLLAGGATLTVNGNGLASDESFTFDGRAESAGSFRFFGGLGVERLTGGSQSDGFFFGAGRFSGAERIDGLAGEDDQLALFGSFGTIVFAAETMRNVDTVVLISGRDPRYATFADYFHYDLQLHDANLAAGATLTVTANGLFLFESATVDGSRETDGSFRLIGGGGDDRLSGGALADVLVGGVGADAMAGGGGADRFIYLTGEDSYATRKDVLSGFEAGDVIDLRAIDADPVAAGDQAFHWAAGSVFTGSVGETLLVQVGGEWQLQIDLDGRNGLDFVLLIQGANGYAPLHGDVLL